MAMTVPMMHEEMHEGTGGQQEEGQVLDDMRPVFCHRK
jgi:hypothetical protein